MREHISLKKGAIWGIVQESREKIEISLSNGSEAGIFWYT